MQLPLEITYRDVEKTEDIETLVREKVARLERFCDHLISCRVAIEKPQAHQRAGEPFRVRIDLRVPPSHEIVAKRNTREGDMHRGLHGVIRDAFDAAEHQLKDLVDKQDQEVKAHPHQEANAVVDRLFSNQGYGFLKSQDGRDVYFHKNSVTGNAFDRLEVGTGVRFVEKEGEEGPQASTVHIIDKRPNSPIV